MMSGSHRTETKEVFQPRSNCYGVYVLLDLPRNSRVTLSDSQMNLCTSLNLQNNTIFHESIASSAY